MQQLIEFTMNHWILVLTFVLVAGFLIFNLLIGDKHAVDPTTATDLINHQDAVVVDVRPAADFHKGHIINAISIPSNGFGNQIGLLSKHKEKPVIISCRSGAQSSAACQQLKKAGFEQVFNLKGGILAWQNANLPITRKNK
ncbi:MAG: rhodanese-like domain-containing protein [Candidatus Thiodiazotropha sp. (ex Lucinoma kastoroae)]|nr:rhodanese-like domain-containing protein [Candidatus Thiodiazotropha sp. (ex Rostrolucina anterorostrata)]MCU7847681.1 rhodanese-like domain-containing protein [Candidatus Thiodiazotropha sp. (ex Lucinoma kastoroae)]MCU7861174.1 rhodanese-like domain-containing protein [Candidatus Thiodiazotropha sp. (ex Lucinoma kastoroae)]